MERVCFSDGTKDDSKSLSGLSGQLRLYVQTQMSVCVVLFGRSSRDTFARRGFLFAPTGYFEPQSSKIECGVLEFEIPGHGF